MHKDILLPAGMYVELMVSPGDIRSTSIRQRIENRITLNQTHPFLDVEYLHHSILMTFKEETKTSRIGYKVEVICICCDPGDNDQSFIEVELTDFIEEYDLRKYPRFNPKLFDRLRISYGEAILDFKDISAGGARGICKSDNLQGITKGATISLNVCIGNLIYSVRAQVMRIKHAMEEGENCEIAVAFMEWDKNFLLSMENNL